jgi:HEAT repeat protein
MEEPVMPLFGRPNVEKLEANGNVRALIKALSYAPDPQVRIEAAEALGRIGDESALGPLSEASEDHAWGDDQSVANAAAGALGKFTLRRMQEAVGDGPITDEDIRIADDYWASVGTQRVPDRDSH